jgi:hypothetical protein
MTDQLPEWLAGEEGTSGGVRGETVQPQDPSHIESDQLFFQIEQ